MKQDVLIAGAGPTGLVLALWLTAQGVKVRIIDKNVGPGPTSRAMVVHARTLELYRQLDLADAVLEAGHRNPSVNLWAKGKVKARISFSPTGGKMTPYPFVLVYPQDHHERMLEARLAALGVKVERQTELVEFEHDAAGVSARLQLPDGCVARYLDGYRGILQIDGYTAYNRVARHERGNDGALLAECWVHSRRRFYELHANDSSKVATVTIERMGVLWSIEEKVRGETPDVRVAARQETSAAVVADLYKLWRDTLPRISGKSKLAEAIRYALSRREAFVHLLHDGRIEIDSNIVERAIRPQAIVRKNSLLAGNAGGGRTP